MKLLSLTINKVDSTSFYRANGVFGDLKQRLPIEIKSMDVKDIRDMNWSDLIMFDVVFMQRPYTAVNLQMARYLRDMKIPLWIDYDDNLFDIPIDNRAHDTFSNEQIRKNISEICSLATVITVSTLKLAEKLSQFNPNIRVIPNALNLKLLKPRPTHNNKTVLWRGSDTHQGELLIFANHIYSSMQQFTDWQFAYFGYNPYFIPIAPNKIYYKPTDPILYLQSIAQMAPSIMQVPLLDNLFNRCKSDIAYLEGTYAGAVCLVPDWTEWQHPGTVRYNTIEQYFDKLKLMLTEKVNFARMNAEAWDYITTTRTLDKINPLRASLIEELCSVKV